MDIVTFYKTILDPENTRSGNVAYSFMSQLLDVRLDRKQLIQFKDLYIGKEFINSKIHMTILTAEEIAEIVRFTSIPNVAIAIIAAKTLAGNTNKYALGFDAFTRYRENKGCYDVERAVDDILEDIKEILIGDKSGRMMYETIYKNLEYIAQSFTSVLSEHPISN